MKSMNDRKMDMNKGEVDSEGFFPEAPYHKKLSRAGEVRGMKYPDTEEEIARDQNETIKATNRSLPKASYRH